MPYSESLVPTQAPSAFAEIATAVVAWFNRRDHSWRNYCVQELKGCLRFYYICRKCRKIDIQHVPYKEVIDYAEVEDSYKDG